MPTRSDAPALAPNGCVLARLAFADGGTAVYRRCGDAFERVAGEGDAVGPHTVRSIEPSVVTSAGGHAAFIARLSDGNVAVEVEIAGQPDLTDAARRVEVAERVPRPGQFDPGFAGFTALVSHRLVRS